jgi:hypothetical protein
LSTKALNFFAVFFYGCKTIWGITQQDQIRPKKGKNLNDRASWLISNILAGFSLPPKDADMMKRLPFLTLTALLAAGVASPALASPDQDQEIAALKAQLSALMKKVDAMEAKQAALPAPADKTPTATTKSAESAPASNPPPQDNTVKAGDLPGSFKVPGTDTSVKIGGYVKLDAIHDITEGYGQDNARFASIPVDGSAKAAQGGETRFHARQTRLNLETSTPTDLGKMKTFVEVDFFGTAGVQRSTNGDGIQLRHAYGSVGPILAGQTWSNMMDVDSMPETLDYVGAAGSFLVRQAQIRYTRPLDENWTASASVENPEGDFTTSGSDYNLDQMPDFVARADYKHADGSLSLRGVARQINVTNDTTRVTSTAYGWGAALSGKQKVFGRDSVMFQMAGGNGIGRYFYDVALTNTGSAYRTGNVVTQAVYGGYTGFQHVWTDTLRTNVFGGFVHIDNDTAILGTAVNEWVASQHINLIWQPAKSYKVGVEFMHGYRSLENNTEGHLNRLQGSFIYSF